ncbi:MAG TPA: hypothetical protein VFK24_10280 [Gammaproteobacteria bacterium]|nr:hypothetical protein [Gammaproteobacteria bacterium]
MKRRPRKSGLNPRPLPPERIANGFKWQPPAKRRGRLPGPPPPRPEETRTPLLFLDSISAGLEGIATAEVFCLFLINATGAPLTYVGNRGHSAIGLERGDDIDVLVSQRDEYAYHDVEPDEAVMIARYHAAMDADTSLGVRVTARSATLGNIELAASARGGLREGVLLWDTGEPGRGVALRVEGKPVKRLQLPPGFNP